jgi:uncharacterized glyoxalase superfamily protein PhnB
MSASFSLKQLTPVLVVDDVEPCIAFWAERLGFTKENEVPDDKGKLVFASVNRDGIEIMYQTRASVAEQSPTQAGELTGHSTVLFITVPSITDLDAIEKLVQGAPVVKERHQTFYGATEFYIREPGGNAVGFAAFG